VIGVMFMFMSKAAVLINKNPLKSKHAQRMKQSPWYVTAYG
jgi:hypothetical protein